MTDPGAEPGIPAEPGPADADVRDESAQIRRERGDEPTARVEEATDGAETATEGPTSTTAGAGGDEPAPVRRPLPSGRAVGVWALLAGVLGALDGWIGAGVAVVIAAVVLAGVSRRLLGGLGVLALAAVPIAVLSDGTPREGEVGPAFVSRSLWPHHLTFAGLVLVSAWVVLDVRHQLAARHAEPAPEPELEFASDPAVPADATGPADPPALEADRPAPPLAGLGDRVRVAIVALVAAAAVAASVAVLLS